MSPKSLEERQAQMRGRMADGNANTEHSPALVVRESESITPSEKQAPKFETRKNGQIVITRQDLYRFVWSEPATKIAKRFGVSDVAVAKACRKNAIPLPGLGYWAKAAAGQKLRRTPFPKSSDADDFIHFMPQPQSPKAEAAIVTSTREVPVPETTRSLHSLVAKTYSVLREQVGAKRRRTTYGNDYGRTWGPEGMLDIKVTESQLSRIVRIMSAIFNAAEKAGHTIRVGEGPSWRRGKEVQVVADGVPMTFDVFEPVRGTKHIHTPSEQRDIDRGSYYGPTYDYHSTGKLQLKMSSHHGGSRTWHDSAAQKLEDMLGVVVDTMMVFSKAEKEWLQKKAIEDKRQAEAARLRYEEENRVKRLEKQLTVWRKARDLREYVQAVEHSVAKRSEQVDPAGELGRWITWMRRYADRLDPSGRDDIGNEDAWPSW
jgi:hypothetical protein